ncbi:MAG: hypothetical protein ACFFDN_04170 [Candidatus Hodarchaeota archaeon]
MPKRGVIKIALSLPSEFIQGFVSLGLMPLNWTLGVYIALISTISMFITFLISFYQLYKNRYRFLVIMTFMWFLTVLWSLCLTLSFLFLSVPLFILAGYFLALIGFFLILTYDLINGESISTIKIVILTILSVSAFFISFDKNSFYFGNFPNGDIGIFVGGYMRGVLSSLTAIMGIFSVYYTTKLYLNAPKKLKSYSLLILIGGVLFGVVSPISIAIGLYLQFPMSHLLIFTIGTSLFSISIAFYPQLAFILPFKVLRLSVIQTHTGISLFTKIWITEDEIIDDGLFSGMLHGISLFLNEALKKGELREMHLDNAKLLIKRSKKYPVACVLISTNSTHSLRTALNSFANDFFEKYSQHFDGVVDLEDYKSANELVASKFSFIPEY